VAVLRPTSPFNRRSSHLGSRHSGDGVDRPLWGNADVRLPSSTRRGSSSTLPQAAAHSLLRHPGLAQAVIRPLAHLDPAWIAALGHLERPPRRDRLDRPGGGQREIALQRRTRFRIMTGQGERRHQDQMRILDVIRSCRDRPASQLDRLIIIPQPKIGPRLTAIPIGEPGSFGFV
jgi:hypothetical protein